MWLHKHILVCVIVLFSLASQAQTAVGNIITVAGTGTAGFSGDGGLSISANLSAPFGVAVDGSGNFYIADTVNNRVRKVNASNYVITTVAGSSKHGFCGDGGPATSACLSNPTGVAIDRWGNIFIADLANYRIRRVDASTHKISTYAGNGTPGFCGDGQPATLACLHTPTGVAVDSQGNVYIADEYSCRIRKVFASNHTITTVAGDGAIGFSGDGGLAIFAELGGPTGVAVDNKGNIYIADGNNQRVRQVNSAGIITTIAGDGSAAYCGDGGPGTSACLRVPYGVAADGVGNVFIADTGNNRIRRLDAVSKKITTVAGGGKAGLGDGGPAIKAIVSAPRGVAVTPVTAGTPAARLFIADQGDQRIREVVMR